MKSKIYKALALILTVICLMSLTAPAFADTYVDIIDPDKTFEAGKVVVTLRTEVTMTEGYEALFPELEGMYESIDRFLPQYYEDGTTNQQLLLITLFDKTEDGLRRAITTLLANKSVLRAKPKYDPPAPFEETMSAEKIAQVYDESNFRYMLRDHFIVALKSDVTIREGYESLFPELEGKIEKVEQWGGFYYDLGMYANQYVLVYVKDKTDAGIVDAILTVKDNEHVVFAEPDHCGEGDLNRDGEISNSDVVILARTVVGLSELDEETSTLADMNVSGEIDNGDLVALVRQIIEA